MAAENQGHPSREQPGLVLQGSEDLRRQLKTKLPPVPLRRNLVGSLPITGVETVVGKTHLNLALLFTLIVLSFLGACAKPRPSLILITVDTLRRDALGIYSPEVSWTPNLDSLGRSGTIWDEARTPFTITQPSHATMLTGLYPAEHGILTNGSNLQDIYTSIAEELSVQGYDCGAFVNTWVLYDTFGFGQGFNYFKKAEKESLDHPIKKDRKKGHLVWVRSNPRAGRTVSMAKQWLRGAGKPFFLWLHLMDPHLDYSPPDSVLAVLGASDIPARLGSRNYLKSRDDIKEPFSDQEISQIRLLYAGEIAHVDMALGDLFHHLRTSEEKTSIIVAVVSDHGEDILDDGSYIGHSRSLHPSVVRIPLLMSGHNIPSGRRIPTSVELVQLKPTLLQLLDNTIPAQSPSNLFSGADRSQLTQDLDGRMSGHWRGWEFRWERDERTARIERRGGSDSLLAASVLDSAFMTLKRLSREPVTRPLSPSEIKELKALGYLE